MIRLTLVVSALASVTVAQVPSAMFEVASVRPSSSVSIRPNSSVFGAPDRGGCHGIDSVYTRGRQGSAPPLGRCVIIDVRLGNLISVAYGVPAWSIKNAPDWVMNGMNGNDFYTIQAKAENASATEQQLLEMLQNLLSDRFELRFHRETKEMPGFALTVAKGGPKLQGAAYADSGFDLQGTADRSQTTLNIGAHRYSMQRLAELLSQFGGRPTVDQTGLTGFYDIRLSWDVADPATLPIAVEEQLGLHLTAQKVPLSYFMFDSARKPTGN
jgi:uncharacterized protein (TIGR03435 family)